MRNSVLGGKDLKRHKSIQHVFLSTTVGEKGNRNSFGQLAKFEWVSVLVWGKYALESLRVMGHHVCNCSQLVQEQNNSTMHKHTDGTMRQMR